MTVVATTAGRVRGAKDGAVFAFNGIPYAAPLVGSLRYRAPKPSDRWDGERDATTFGPICLQQPAPGILGEFLTPTDPAGDDCLNLNVWTPELGASRLPVLVWIHGGGFFQG